METQNTLNRSFVSRFQNNLEKENQIWKNQPSWLQTMLQSYSHQDSMVLAQRQKYKSMNKIESPEINQHTCGRLIFDTGGKQIQWIKDSLFNKWCCQNWTATYKRMKLQHSNRWGNSGNSVRLYFWGVQNHCRW